jgi:hypothetical protein
VQTLKIFKKMRTKVTETENGKQLTNPGDNDSRGSKTSENDGSSQDGSFGPDPTTKPAISESGNGVPQSPRPGEGIELQREPSMESTLKERQSQPSESSTGNDTIPYVRESQTNSDVQAVTKPPVIPSPRSNKSASGSDIQNQGYDLENQTAATIGTVDLDSEDSNDSNDVERDKPKTGIIPFIKAAIIVATTNPFIGGFAQLFESLTRPTAPPESNAQNATDLNGSRIDGQDAIDFTTTDPYFLGERTTTTIPDANASNLTKDNETDLNGSRIDGQDAIDFTNADPYFLGERTTTTTPDANASNLTKDNETDLNGSRIDGQDATELERTPFDGQDASNLTKSNERRLEASPDDETASVYSDSRNKEEHEIYIGDALCGSLRGAVATGVDAVNEFGFAPPCPILLAVMINLNRKLDRLPAGSNTNLKDLFGQLCGAIIGLVGISLVYYSLPTKSDYVGNLIINPLGNTFTNILRRRVAKYLKKPKKPAFIGPIQRQPKEIRQLNEQKKLREEARNQKIDLFFKVGGRFCNRILQLILQASMTGVMASARFLLIFGSANVAKELAAALALEYAKSKNRPGSSNDHVQAQTMESPSIPREAPPTTRDLDGFIIPLAKAKAKAKTAAKKAKAKTPAKKTPAKANKLAL